LLLSLLLVEGPYFSLIPVLGLAIVACFALSLVTKNYSWVDRTWSVLPPVYIGCVAAASEFANPRLNLMAGVASIWGARLTYNFARKGGYRLSEEDYRWAELRKILGAKGFQVFNATFIAPYQNVLLFLLAAPAHTAWRHRTPLSALDFVLALVFIVFLLGETVADNQQWRFHVEKASARSRGQSIDPPFLTRGLFRFSRHPNFFCEIAMWWVMYGFAVSASGELVSWSVLGAVLLHLLFLGSTAFTERITLGKYPSYASYQRTTSRLIPWIGR
jgi:steroid 5-alpha reductase family enzyme